MITRVFASRARLASLSPTSRASSVAASASFLRGVFCSSVPFSRPRGILSSLSSKESGTSVGAHLFPSPQRVWSVALARSFSTDSGSQGERDTHAVAVKGWKDKPISQWTEQDVGEWLKTNEKFEPLLPILKNLSGRDLVQLTKEELNELLRTLGSGTLTPQHASIGLAFFNTIQELKRPPIDPESHLIPEATPEYRSLEKWNWLREFPELVLLDAEAREKQIAEKWCNRFYPIPRLGDDVPKGMELQKFELLLTRQRIELALEFCRSLRLGVEQSFSSDPPPAKGYILSGPNGVGKTAISYLLACIAWANDAILVYSPLTSKWTHGDTVTQARYLMRRFLFFNATKAATIKATRGKSLFDVVHEGTEDHELTLTAYNTMLEVLATIDHPVVYIVDEHNEIYREPERQLHKRDVFKPFDRCTDYTVGKRIFTVLSGSAHSRFERALQPAMEDWVRRVRPLDEQSFRVMLAWYREKNGKPKADDAETKLVFQVTGGVPRELFFFEKSTESLEDWTKDRQNALADQLDTFVTEKLKNRTKLFMSFLQRMVSSALPSSGNRARPPGRYVDLGIIGFDGSVWRPTCLPARRALEMYYFTEGADGSSNAWLSECRTGTEMGLAFQRRVRDALTFGLHFSEDAGLFRIADAKKPEQGRRKLAISLPPAWQFDRLESPNTEALDQSPCLFIPETQNHPAWDFVFYDPKNARVVFIQTSISQFRQGKQGYDHKFVKSFQSNAGANGVQGILERITRGEVMVSISEDGTFDVRITRDKAKVSIEILWLFVTTTPRDRLLQAERNLKDPRGNAACPDVIVIPKEACLEAKIVSEDDFNPPSAKARGAKRKGKKASTDPVSQNRLPERK